MLPRQKDVEVPLLQVLVDLGGQAEPKKVYPLVTSKFPEITEEEREESLPSGGKRWTNRIQWVRQHLVEKGDMDSPAYGVWRITEQGRKRLDAATPENDGDSHVDFMELYEEYETRFRGQLLGELHDLTPRQFEIFARRLLSVYGFADVCVTSISSDGGVDGYGNLRLGLASMRVAFQCKRWQGNVGRVEVDRFRGAIQGEFEQGIFFTTSDFTQTARDASLKRGAVPVILLNGERIVNLMIEKGLGVKRMPLYRYELVPEELDSDEE